MLDGEVEQFARGRVDPMRVLQNRDRRLLARQTFELSNQRLQCPFLLTLRTEVRERVALRSRQGQQISDERHILLGRYGAGEQSFEFPQLSDGRIVASKPGCPPELVNKRE